MDQKKTLWIVTASGVFLAVVVLAALILNKPSSTKIPATASISPIEKPVVENYDDSDFATEVENSVEYPSVENLAAIEENQKSDLDLEIVSAPENENLVDSENQNLAEENAQVPNENPTVVIDLNQVNNISIQNEKDSVRPRNSATAKVLRDRKNNGSEKSSFNDDTIYTAEKKSATRDVDFEKVPAKKSSTSKVAKNDSVKNENQKSVAKSSDKKSTEENEFLQKKYWVQCASYSSKKTAEAARSALDQNKIPVEVFTYKDSKNNLYYRVRVGPYMTKSEAEYWQSRIATIEMFKNVSSYITQN